MEQLEIKAAGSADRQTLEGVLCGNFGSLSLKSQGSFFTAPQGDIKLRVVDFEPGLLGLKVEPETYISADFDGRFSLPELTRPDRLMVEWRSESLRLPGRLSPGEIAGTFYLGKTQVNPPRGSG